MTCWRGLEEIPADWSGCAVTIGVFDGVHRGHQHVVKRAVARAGDVGVPTVAVTFAPRPVELFAPDKAPPLLTTVSTRVHLLGELGVDAVLVLPFTRELSQLSPDDFVRTVLIERLGARAVVVGDAFRFGHRAAGDVALLRKLGEGSGFAVEGVAPVSGGGTEPYSSSRARDCVASGDVAAASKILGRPHRVEGTVQRGDGRGREIGYPTANLDYPPDLAIPADGVYAGWLRHPPDQRQPAAISIGTNPTFSGQSRTVEAYALDRGDLELYGAHVTVDFVERLRETLRFDSVAGLVDEMGRDVERTREVLAG